MDHLVDEGVKLLVIACNSASSAVLRDARERYNVPVVEVIQPAVRRAVAATRNGHVGVIGTRATIASRAYEDSFAAAPHLQITTHACPRFVDFVEDGITQRPRDRGRGPRLPGAAARRRHRHARAGLHALSAADRRAVVRHGRRRDARLERRGDGQGRLPRPRRARAAPRRPAAAAASTSSAPPETRRPSPSWPDASSAPRSSAVAVVEEAV